MESRSGGCFVSLPTVEGYLLIARLACQMIAGLETGRFGLIVSNIAHFSRNFIALYTT
jgi:hypothetical protein